MIDHFYWYSDMTKTRRPFGRWVMRSACLAVALIASISHACCADEVKPARTELDLNNPHKGFMLWGTDYAAGAPENFHGSSVFHIYVPWREVENSAAWKGRWVFDLSNVLPGQTLHVTEPFTAEGIEPDSYSIRLGVLNPRRNHKPGVLIQSAGRDSNNRYHLGTIKVTK